MQATALAYFKRFYVNNSCLEYDPAKIMPTCIYLACKVWYGPILLAVTLPAHPKSMATVVSCCDCLHQTMHMHIQPNILKIHF